MPDPTGTLTLVTAVPQLGQPCVFHVTTEGLQGKKFPRVHVEAKQGDRVVYGEIREIDGADGTQNPDNGICTFPYLGGNTGSWPNTPPPVPDPTGPADCVARLFYADPHGAQIDLMTMLFGAAGL